MLSRRGIARVSSAPLGRFVSQKSVGFPVLSRVLSTAVADDHSEIYGVEPITEVGEWAGCKRSFLRPLSVGVRGCDILHHPLYNKGTAFKHGERDRLRFRGLLPARALNIHFQKERFLISLRAESSNIKKNLMLEDLHDRNETLYHRVLVDHIEEMAPIIYTPTVGQACVEFATHWRRPRGMYFSEQDRGHIAAMLYNWPHRDVRVIVVTDGSRTSNLAVVALFVPIVAAQCISLLTAVMFMSCRIRLFPCV
jgi:hypothetical protein